MIRLLRRYLRPYSGYLAAVLGLQLLQAMAALTLPSLNASIIDKGVTTGDTGYIWALGAVMLVVSLVQIGGQIGAAWFGSRSAMAFGRDLRQAIFDRALSFSAREMNSFGAPTLITRNTNDVQQLQMLVQMTTTMIISAPLMMIGGVVMALREDVGLSWLIVVAAGTLGAVIGILITQTLPLFKAMQVRIDTLNRVMREYLSDCA
jgi:ATP-binding cassette subfamily B protein